MIFFILFFKDGKYTLWVLLLEAEHALWFIIFLFLLFLKLTFKHRSNPVYIVEAFTWQLYLYLNILMNWSFYLQYLSLNLIIYVNPSKVNILNRLNINTNLFQNFWRVTRIFKIVLCSKPLLACTQMSFLKQVTCL